MSTAKPTALPLQNFSILRKNDIATICSYKLSRAMESNSREYEQNHGANDSALQVRRQWMSMMGLGDEEIENHCQPGTVADLDEELAEYAAIIQIQARNQKIRDGRAG